MADSAKSSGARPASEPPLRLAMLGMIAGNGHPYSWSAIINGYDPAAMATCPYPGITQYLGARPAGSVRVPGAQVTHIWTDDPAEAASVARASLIPNVVSRPEDVIGHVDAVLVSTDDGTDHVRRARPFVEAGLPVFVDKPLATTIEDLRTFVQWEKSGAPILSSSGMRFAPELAALRSKLGSFGDLRWVSWVTIKTWDRYGIHALEPVFKILGPGFVSVRLESQPGLEVAHLLHRSGTQVTLPVIYDGAPSFGTCQVCGTKAETSVRFSDTYSAFRGQLVNYIEFLRSRQQPYPFAETVEMMAVIIAGIRSRAENSRRVTVEEITAEI